MKILSLQIKKILKKTKNAWFITKLWQIKVKNSLKKAEAMLITNVYKLNHNLAAFYKPYRLYSMIVEYKRGENQKDNEPVQKKTY